MAGTEVFNKMAGTEVFDDFSTFERWDAEYYPPTACRYYDRAVRDMLGWLGAGPDDLILDAGCGPGRHSIRAAQAGCRVQAIDISDAAIAEARRRAAKVGLADRIRFEQADLTQLPFEDGSFEHIFSWGVVIHIPAAEEALAELVRILAPGGKLALYVTNKNAWDYPLLSLARRVLRRPTPPLESSHLGQGCWFADKGDSLWVWRFAIDALTAHLESLGLRRTHRVAGQFTEIQRRLRGPARKAMLLLNNAWYRLGLPPGPCVTNLLVFEKPSA